MKGRRLFNNSEKTVLYINADGKCENCGEELGAGWHADHIHPYSKGGATALVNGQALCPACNLKKGSNIIMEQQEYHDKFQPRPFQEELIGAVVNNTKAGEKLTVAIASPGSGKTLAYQAAATALIREGAIDMVAVFAPRIVLAEQCELEYHDAEDRGHYELFDPTARLESIVHRENKTPLTTPGAKRTGYVTTYQSLVNDPRIHLDWARRYAGRFLLIGDEAQFLGSDGELEKDETGTKAGKYFQELHEYAAHTVMLTGTEKRADNGELVLATYQTRPDGKRYLVPDVRARYSDGIAQGYLRPFEATVIDAEVERTNLDSGEKTLSQLSENSEQLGKVLAQKNVWMELADKCVEQLVWAQYTNPSFKGLIACQNQTEARKVYRHLKSRGVSADLSISDDGAEAGRVLDAFRFNASDFLVTVRKAFLGYDCKAITVVGLLTNYRDYGHLEQLVGRGLRMWDQAPEQEQWCRIVAPADAGMKRFLEHLQQENDQGLGQRKNRTGDDDFIGCGPDGEPSPVVIEDARVTSVTATGHAGYVGRDELPSIHQLYESVPASRKLSQADLLAILSFAQGEKPEPAPEVPSGPRMTRKQRISEYLKKANGELKAVANLSANYGSNRAGWANVMKSVTADVNNFFGIRSTSSIEDIETAKRYWDAARKYRESFSA